MNNDNIITMKIVSWDVSPLTNKKYRVILSNGRHVDFGDRRYQHYKDQTPLKVFSYLNHGDMDRRRSYYNRHNREYPKYSADWLSKKYLW
jgi:hypothetical protein